MFFIRWHCRLASKVHDSHCLSMWTLFLEFCECVFLLLLCRVRFPLRPRFEHPLSVTAQIMDDDEGSTMGPGGHIKRAFKRTMGKLKSRRSASGYSSSGDTRRRHSTMSVSELEAQPLRYSEDPDDETHRDSLDACGERLSALSTSPQHRTYVYSPAPLIPPKRPRPPRHVRGSSLGVEELSRAKPPGSDPFLDRVQVTDEERAPGRVAFRDMRRKEVIHETGDSGGTKELCTTLAEKLKQCQSNVDIGQFLVSNYCDNDAVLDGVVTRMTADQESTAAIADAVLKKLDLAPQPPKFPKPISGHKIPPNPRYYSQPDGTGGFTEPPSTTRPTTCTSRRQEQEVSPTTMMVSRPPVSKRSFVPYRPRAAARSPSPPCFTGANLFRVRDGALVAPQPHQCAPIFPRWTEGVLIRTKCDLDIREANLSRREVGASDKTCQVTDDDIPILQTATIERVKRGYYDERLDRPVPQPRKATDSQEIKKDIGGPMEP